MGAEDLDRFFGLPPVSDVTWAGSVLSRGERLRLDPEHETDLAGPGGPHEIVVPVLRATKGESLVGAETRDGRRVTLVARGDSGVELGFDPDATVRTLIRRHVYLKKLPWYGRMPFHYRKVPPRIRALVRDLLGSRVNADVYPAWPVDASIEALRRTYLFARQVLDGTTEPRPFWPKDKTHALAITHDVDSAEGQGRVRSWMEEEEGIGVRSCFYVVGNEYEVDRQLWSEANDRGFEVGLHGDRHDHKLAFSSETAIRSRLASCASLTRELSMSGFRSPSLFRTRALIEAVGETFEYDSSVPDTGLLPTAENGCGTVFPFDLDGVCELPVTVPADGTLLARGFDGSQILSAWIAKTEWIAAMGGLAVFLAHPEEGFSAEPLVHASMTEFLEQASAADGAWVALPRDIAEFWQDRDKQAVSIHE